MSRPPRSIIRESTDAARAQFAAEAATAAEDGDDWDAADDRPDIRVPQRDNMRAEETSQARAARRAREIIGDIEDLDEGPDEFAIDARDIPEGWTYEWKRQLTVGAEDPAYEVSLKRKGWEEVPASRHPNYMPPSMRDGNITRKGMVLMERPKVITDKVKANDLRRALLQVKTKRDQLSNAGAGQFERRTKDGSLVKVNTSFEPMDIPE